MLVGGTGIAPMLQALHAILGTAGDTTRVSVHGTATRMQTRKPRPRPPPSLHSAATLH